VGTCGALAGDLSLGDLIVADAALAADGTSRALGAGDRVAADGGLVAALRDAAGDGARTGAVATTDLFYDRDRRRVAGWADAGALAIEMEAATLLRVAELRGVRAACVLLVSDVFENGVRRRLEPDALAVAAERLGAVGAAALAQRVT
jgi:uridine phosphorylase